MASAVLSPAENNYVGPQGWRFGLAFTSLCVCNFLVALDLVIVAPTIQVIAVHLNATSNQVFWCGTGYVLAQTIVQPLYGSLSEVFGRKILLQTALIIFFVASILCAEAQSIKWLIACRVVQGVGGGGKGQLLQTIRKKHPHLTGRFILQDLPSTIKEVNETKTMQQINVETMAYDFFQPQPIKEARYYYLRRICHDWPDTAVIQILKQVYNAIAASARHSRLLVEDFILPEVGCTVREALQDISMMIGTCGTE